MSDRRAKAIELGLELVPATGGFQQDAEIKEISEGLTRLGYRKMNDTRLSYHELVAGLHRANVDAYTHESVAAYKAMMLKKHHRPKLETASVVASGLGLIVGGIACIGLAIWTIHFLADLVFNIAPLAGFFNGSWKMLALGAFMLLGGSVVNGHLGTAAWNRTELKDFQSEFPLDIAKRILAVNQQLPNARFFIEQFTARKDPILFVNHDGQELAIGVWDEPDFKGEVLV